MQQKKYIDSNSNFQPTLTQNNLHLKTIKFNRCHAVNC